MRTIGRLHVKSGDCRCKTIDPIRAATSLTQGAVSCRWQVETMTMAGASPLRPHPASDVFLLGADRVGVDRGGGELGVAEPFLHEVERDAGGDGGDPKPVAEP